jgi:integrase
MRTGWDSACKRAGVPGAWFHDLRRTAVMHLERAGVPRSVATKLTGHKTEAVYRRYAIADAVALAEGVEKLAKLHAAKPEPAKVVSLAR